ncbi:hypothetical protein CU097_001047, partial [Rhizopus azygosporus]
MKYIVIGTCKKLYQSRRQQFNAFLLSTRQVLISTCHPVPQANPILLVPASHSDSFQRQAIEVRKANMKGITTYHIDKFVEAVMDVVVRHE